MHCTLRVTRCSKRLCKHNKIPLHIHKYNSTATTNIEKLLPQKDEFQNRHIGPREYELTQMLQTIGFKVRHTYDFYRNYCNYYYLR